MKTSKAVLPALLLAVTVPTTGMYAQAARAVPPPLRIRISIDRKTDTERTGLKRRSRRLDAEYRKRRLRGTDVTTERVKARLEIRNMTPDPMSGLVAEIVFLGDARPDWRKSVFVEQARQTVAIEDLAGLGLVDAESQAVEFAVKRTLRAGGQRKGRESGREFAGVAVRIIREGRVIAEAFSPTSRARGFREALSWGADGGERAAP